MNVIKVLPLLIVLNNEAFCSSKKHHDVDILYTFKVPRFQEGAEEEFIPPNVIMIDIDYWQDPVTKKEKYFVTTPRVRPGTPASLSTIGMNSKNEPELRPYPSWEANRANCNSMVSAFRTQIDVCNRLWVVDPGMINGFLPTHEQLCPQKLWLYDLKTDKLIGQYEIPNDLITLNTMVSTIAVDVRYNECDDAFAYMADPAAFALYVFSLKEETFWYFRNRLLYPYPLDGEFTVSGVTYDRMSGTIAIAVGPLIDGDRTVYLHSLSSRVESSVKASVLRNRVLAGDSTAAQQMFHVSHRTRATQAPVEAYWDNALYFNMLGENSIVCWNIHKTYKESHIHTLYKNETIIQYVTGIKAINGNLYMMDNTFHKYISNIFNEDELNYRIIRANIDQLTKGKECHEHK